MKIIKISLVLLMILKLDVAFSQEDKTSKYKRSSLLTLMVTDSKRKYNSEIETSFTSNSISEKFNDHKIKVRLVPLTILTQAPKPEKKKKKKKKKGLFGKTFDNIKKNAPKIPKKQDIQDNLTKYLNESDIARELVAKWFNRSSQGGFNMNLISERGYYNASSLDIKVARSSERGLALLSDAGEELIKNTFVVVNDFKYIDKKEVLGKVGKIGEVVAQNTNSEDVAKVSVGVAVTGGVFGKGYVVKTTAYLYRLVWNDEIANRFYNEFWTEDGNINQGKKSAFDQTDLFKLELVGVETSWADVQSTVFSKKTPKDLIARATTRASDNVIAKLQRKYEVFRTKTPLISSDPLAASIGLKEGLEKGDKYEVLEQVLQDDGTTEYKRVGVIRVDEEQIWDNTFMPDLENTSEIKYTRFKGAKNKYFAGMLIRQIN